MPSEKVSVPFLGYPDFHDEKIDFGFFNRFYAVQLFRIADRPDPHAVPGVVVDRDPPHVRLDALQGELRRTRSASSNFLYEPACST